MKGRDGGAPTTDDGAKSPTERISGSVTRDSRDDTQRRNPNSLHGERMVVSGSCEQPGSRSFTSMVYYSRMKR